MLIGLFFILICDGRIFSGVLCPGTECAEVGFSGEVSQLSPAALNKGHNCRGTTVEKPGFSFLFFAVDFYSVPRRGYG